MGLLDNRAIQRKKTHREYYNTSKTPFNNVDYGHTTDVTSYDVLQNNDALLH
jgi:hypothetical protein